MAEENVYKQTDRQANKYFRIYICRDFMLHGLKWETVNE